MSMKDTSDDWARTVNYDPAYPLTRVSLTIIDHHKLLNRIAELEAQVAALTPKPVVSTSWRNLYNDYGAYNTKQDAFNSRCSGFIGAVRVDEIKHPDGRVEYKLEVEND